MVRSRKTRTVAAGLAALLFAPAAGELPALAHRQRAGAVRERERALLAMAELAESLGRHADALADLDELRAMCAPIAGCETPAAEILERIGWACLEVPACAPRRLQLLTEVARLCPGATELQRDLRAAVAERGRDEAERQAEAAGPGARGGAAEIDRLRAALAAHPADDDRRMDLAEALLAAARPEEGARELSLYLHHRPEDQDARERLVEALVGLGRRAEAIEQIRLHVARRPDAWSLRAELVDLLELEQREDERDLAVAALLREAPDRALGWTFVAERAIERHDLGAAEEALARARAATATDAVSRERLAQAERDLGLVRASDAALFRGDVRQLDLEDDLRYGGEVE